MRVINHKQFAVDKHKHKTSRSRRGSLLFGVILVAIGGYIIFGQKLVSKKPDNKPQTETAEKQIVQTPVAERTKLKTFTGSEFQKLYSSFAYPNTQPLQEKPTITGDKEADDRIRKVAESRGYKLSSVPVANIVKTGEAGLTEDDLIQPNALKAWQDMKAAALKDGVKLQMTSAYRSVEVQRALFLRRMKDDFVYTESVAAGYVDHLVEKLLTRAAPPGYSRHHTGYTIDLACDGIGLDAFTTTSCYKWLSKNNYESTKKFGWVPSYPDGANLQGPEPEPWEYIWVSTYSLYE